MHTYRIHRLKEHLRRQFRYAPHVAGQAQVKPRDYDPGESVSATSPYQAFFLMRDNGQPLEVGDLLEAGDGALRICKFVGFEEAVWVVPEPKPAGVASSPVPDTGNSDVAEPATA